MNSTILVPLDGSARSEAALRPAGELALALGAEVALMRAAEPGDEREPLEDYLDNVAHRCGAAATGPRVVVTDEPVQAILSTADELGAGLVCMATHGRGGLRRLVLGSVTEEVVGASLRAVLLVGPRCDERPTFERVVLCVDGPHSEQALGPAIEMATGLGVPLWLVEAARPGLPPDSTDLVDSAFLQQLARRVRVDHDVRVEWEVPRGADPAEAIARHVSDGPGALVVATTHSRTGVKRAALGSVAMRLAHDLTAPLLVQRLRD
jgi:nucleotide-binding universal stress UspA family protein